MKYSPDYQLSLLINEEIIAVINTVPLHFDEPLQDLPDRGVDWGVEKSVHDHENRKVPNTLMGMQIVVLKAYRGMHLSSTCLTEMTGLAGQQRCETVILPVRPNGKHNFPLIPMEQYIRWENEDGLPYDQWLRVYTRLGGEVIQVCSQSMIIPRTVSEWSRWTNLEFPGTGQYIISGARNPVKIDIDKNQGGYQGPNVWVAHTVK